MHVGEQAGQLPEDERLTTQMRQLRTRVRAFAQAEVLPRVAGMEAAAGGEVEHELVRHIARQGWLGLTIPRAYGGMEAGHLAKTVAIEELSRISAAMGAALQASQLGVAKILDFGSRPQKARWLPLIASGEILPTIAVTEETSGGHVLGMQTTARRSGRHYILHGRKVHVGNSEIADLHGVVARTGTRSDGQPLLSAFLVDKDTPGLRPVRRRTAMGLRGFSFDELELDGCRVPAANRLGAEGDGRDIAYSSSITYGRPNLTAVALGVHRAVFEAAVRICTQRARYGRPLGEVDVVRARLGEIHGRLLTCRSLAYEAAALLDAGIPCGAQLMNAKLQGVRGAMDSARDALSISGGDGLFTDQEIERCYRDAAHLDAPAGTGDIQLHRLGEMALGRGKDIPAARDSTAAEAEEACQ